MESDLLTRVLGDVIETLEDGKRGYEQAAAYLDRLQRPDLAREMRQHSDHRSALGGEIHDVAARYEITLEAGGSAVAALHRRWMKLRETTSSDGVARILSAAKEGDDHAVAEYERALDEDLPHDVRLLLSRQLSEIQLVHDETRRLRDDL